MLKQKFSQPNTAVPTAERMSMVVSIILIGLALYSIIDLPTRTFIVSWLGLSATITLSVRVLVAMLLGGLALSGTGAVVHGNLQPRTRYTTPFWVNPTLLVIFSTLILARLGSPLHWAIGLLTTGVLLWLTIAAENTLSLEPAPPPKTMLWAQIWSQGMSYALLLNFSLLIFAAAMASGWRVALLTAIAGMLGASVLRVRVPATAYAPFAAIIALAVGQLVWVFTFLPISALQASLLLPAIFHVILGIAKARLERTLSVRVFVEYGIVLAASMMVVWWLG